MNELWDIGEARLERVVRDRLTCPLCGQETVVTVADFWLPNNKACYRQVYVETRCEHQRYAHLEVRYTGDPVHYHITGGEAVMWFLSSSLNEEDKPCSARLNS